jgi:hypothetical protein
MGQSFFFSSWVGEKPEDTIKEKDSNRENNKKSDSTHKY